MLACLLSQFENINLMVSIALSHSNDQFVKTEVPVALSQVILQASSVATKKEDASHKSQVASRKSPGKDSPNLAAIAQKIGGKVKRRAQDNFRFYSEVARELFDLQGSCFKQLGEKAGKKEFQQINKAAFSECYYLVDLLMTFFEWFEQLSRGDRQLVAQKAGHWPPNTFKYLPLVPIPLDQFFYLVDLYQAEHSNTPGSAISKLVKALKGKREVSWDKPLTVIDWAFFAGLGNIYFEKLDLLRERSHRLAVEAGREKADLEDALAALESIGYSVELGELIVSAAVKLEKTYTEAELEQVKEEARLERLEIEAQYRRVLEGERALYQQQLQEKQAEIDLLNQKITDKGISLPPSQQINFSSNQSERELVQELAAKDAEIVWQQKLLSAAYKKDFSNDTSLLTLLASPSKLPDPHSIVKNQPSDRYLRAIKGLTQISEEMAHSSNNSCMVNHLNRSWHSPARERGFGVS